MRISTVTTIIVALLAGLFLANTPQAGAATLPDKIKLVVTYDYTTSTYQQVATCRVDGTRQACLGASATIDTAAGTLTASSVCGTLLSGSSYKAYGSQTMAHQTHFYGAVLRLWHHNEYGGYWRLLSLTAVYDC